MLNLGQGSTFHIIAGTSKLNAIDYMHDLLYLLEISSFISKFWSQHRSRYWVPFRCYFFLRQSTSPNWNYLGGNYGYLYICFIPEKLIWCTKFLSIQDLEKKYIVHNFVLLCKILFSRFKLTFKLHSNILSLALLSNFECIKYKHIKFGTHWSINYSF